MTLGGPSSRQQLTKTEFLKNRKKQKKTINDNLKPIENRNFRFDFTPPNCHHRALASHSYCKNSLQILATHCEYFEGAFFGDFVDRNKEEHELPDVDPDEFEKFKAVIYPSQKALDGIRALTWTVLEEQTFMCTL